MSGICLTCLSKVGLTVLSEDEWSIFDFIMNPHIKKHNDLIRNNTMSRICSSCQSSLHYVENFRRSATRSFLQLIGMWNQANKDPLNCNDLIKSEPVDDEKDNFIDIRSRENQSKTKIENLVHKVKRELVVNIEYSKEAVEAEVQSDETEAQSRVCSWTSVEPSTATSSAPNVAPNTTPRVESSPALPNKYQSKLLQTTNKQTHEASFRTHRDAPTSINTQDDKTPRNMEIHTKQHKGNIVYCEPCDKWFNHIYYKKHIEISAQHNTKEQLDALRVQCPVCSAMSANKETLRRHMRKEHDGAKGDVFCKICNRWYTATSYNPHLKLSLKHISKEDFKFSCADCGWRSIKKHSLRRHIMVKHLLLKPFACSLCPSGFKTAPQLKKHVLTVHEHKAVPKKHICHVCGSAWENTTMLRVHMVTHTGERPYRCKQCGATFCRSGGLSSHKRSVHEGVKLKRTKKKKIISNEKINKDLDTKKVKGERRRKKDQCHE